MSAQLTSIVWNRTNAIDLNIDASLQYSGSSISTGACQEILFFPHVFVHKSLQNCEIKTTEMLILDTCIKRLCYIKMKFC